MKRGFSLIEMIVYVAIVSATFILVVNVCLTLSRSYTSLQYAKSIQNAVAFGLESVVRETRGASFASVENGTLTLQTLYDGTPSVVDFYLLNSVLYMNRDGEVEGPLTQKNISIDDLAFTVMATSTSEAVKIEMTIGQERFYDTVVLRGSYK